MGTSSGLRGKSVAEIWLAAMLLCAGLVGRATAADPAPPAEANLKIAEVVRQLGAPSYALREHASHELAKLGSQAKPEVAKALDSRDPEVRYRARQAYAKIVDEEFKQRVAAFIADATGKVDHELPGWERFRKLAGNAPVARRLFVEMLQAEPLLMESLERNGKQLPNVGLTVDARVQQITFWMQNAQFANPREPQQLRLGSIAALLFVGSDPDVAISTNTAAQVSNWSYQQEFQTAMTSKDRVEPLKRLLGAWISRDLGSQHSMQAVMMALRFDLREGIEPSLALVRGGATTPQLRQYAILGLGKLGGKQHLPDLEPLLKDEAICAAQQVGQKQVQTRICDVALAVMIRLSGQQLRDYGFTRVQENSMMLYNVSSLGFIEDPQRQTAIKKWRDWLKTQSASQPAAAEATTTPKSG